MVTPTFLSLLNGPGACGCEQDPVLVRPVAVARARSVSEESGGLSTRVFCRVAARPGTQVARAASRAGAPGLPPNGPIPLFSVARAGTTQASFLPRAKVSRALTCPLFDPTSWPSSRTSPTGPRCTGAFAFCWARAGSTGERRLPPALHCPGDTVGRHPGALRCLSQVLAHLASLGPGLTGLPAGVLPAGPNVPGPGDPRADSQGMGQSTLGSHQWPSFTRCYWGPQWPSVCSASLWVVRADGQ